MLKQAIYILLSVSFFLAQSAQAQLNLNYHYDVNAPVLCQWSQAGSLDSLLIWSRVTIPKNEIADFIVSYQLANDEKGANIIYTDTLNASQLVSSGDRNHLITIDLSSKIEQVIWVYLFFREKNSDKLWTFYYRIQPPNGGLFLKDASAVPMATRFVRQGEQFSVSALKSADSIAWVYYYSQNFPQADIPMESKPTDSKMTLDSLFTIKLGSAFEIQKEGLYLIKTDTSAKYGLSFILTDPYYPRHVQIEDVIHSVVYISTNNEYLALTNAVEKKKTLDRFWLNLLKYPDRAKVTIKNYYQKVEEANLLFSTYKEGWKTDMGMIYIIYGQPQEVYSYGNKEEWIYNLPQDNSRISFTFVQVNTIFGGSFYALIREKRHSRHWNKAIELWRIGRK